LYFLSTIIDQKKRLWPCRGPDAHHELPAGRLEVNVEEWIVHLAAILKALAVFVLACVVLPDVADAATHIVNIEDCVLCGGGFIPRRLTIQAGDTVEWRNAPGGNRHDVTANDGSFKSPTASSFTFSHTFDSPGTVGYHCSIAEVPILGLHGGSIIVLTNIAPADLALQSVDAAADIYNYADLIPVSVTLQNLGAAASGEFLVRFYASIDSTITSDDLELASTTRPSLSAGQSSTFTFEVPAELGDGSHYIGTIIEVIDANNANNAGADLSAVDITPFQFNSGMNDAWFNPSTPGQGMFITVFPDRQKLFLGWFTYEVERPADGVTAILGDPGHRWLTAFGGYSGSTATLEIELTEGGVIDSVFPQPVRSPYGTALLHVANCNLAYLDYNIPSLGRSGVIPLQRVVRNNIALCKALQTP
jgi:plastocyanin